MYMHLYRGRTFLLYLGLTRVRETVTLLLEIETDEQSIKTI